MKENRGRGALFKMGLVLIITTSLRNDNFEFRQGENHSTPSLPHPKPRVRFSEYALRQPKTLYCARRETSSLFCIVVCPFLFLFSHYFSFCLPPSGDKKLKGDRDYPAPEMNLKSWCVCIFQLPSSRRKRKNRPGLLK